MVVPPEILEMICSHMSKEALKTTRLACKALEQAAVRFLFNEVFLSSTHSDIEVTNRVTSRFAEYIKTITLSFRSFLPFSDDSIMNMFRADRSLDFDHQRTQDHIRHARRSYCKARAEHIEITESGGLLAQLRQILAKSPNIRKVALTDRGCDSGCLAGELDSYDIWKKADLCPYDTCDLSEADHINVHIRPTHGYQMDKPNPWQLTMLALSSTNTTVTEITLSSAHCSGLLTKCNFLVPVEQVQGVNTFLNNLTKLRLSISKNVCCPDHYDHSISIRGVMARTLAAATNLQGLFLEGDAGLEREEPQIETSVSCVFKGCRFTKLKSLALMYLYANEDELLAFLQASPHLKHLFLRYIELNVGTWETMAARIRELLQLRQVEISKPYGGSLKSDPLFPPDINSGEKHSDPRLVEDFFMRDGENPFTEKAMKVFCDNNDVAARAAIGEKTGDYEAFCETYC